MEPTTARRLQPRRYLPIALIGLGLALTIFFGLRAFSSFNEIRYVRDQGLMNGTASVDAVRPWMTVRFIAVAYAVPEEYLYNRLNIPFDHRNENRPLGRLNQDYKLGTSPNGNYPAIVDTARAAITEYRANPVVTGLRDVRPWMSVRYIANSTGVPANYIFSQIGVPSSENESKPLDLLAKEQHYDGGPRALADAVQRALSAYHGAP